MAASIQLAPQGTKIVRISFISRTGIENTIAVEQLPGPAGYRMPLATMINFWDIYSHMKGKTYCTIEALLDDAHPGWQSWQEEVQFPIMTNAQETAVIKAALKGAGIRPKSVRHYLGPIIIVMGRPEAYEGEFLQIETLALEALDRVPDVKNCCSGIHVFSEFHGKLAAGYERFRRYKR